MIRLVLWDIDGTLLNFLAAEKVAIRSCFAIFQLGECTDEMLEKYSAINVRYWKMLERGEMTKPAILVGRFREFFEQYGLDVTVAEAFNAEYQIRLGDTICFYDKAVETLQALKPQVRQIAVTNGTRTAQEIKLKKSGLETIFDDVFISECVGYEKPDQRFFDVVFAKYPEYQRDEVLIVGDSLTSDVRGGLNAGIHTCLFQREPAALPLDCMPEHVIGSLAEVTALVQEEPHMIDDYHLIWDLDGTLLDSYTVIVNSMAQVLQDVGVTMEIDAIHQFAIKYSVNDLMAKVSAETGIPHQELRDRYTVISHALKETIGCMPEAKATLETLNRMGVHNHVYTHRGISTEAVLRNNDIFHCFEKIVTSVDGFKRKPDPEGIQYLVDQLTLSKKTVFYVGDRQIDMECARNAGVNGIIYLPEGSIAPDDDCGAHKVEKLSDIIGYIRKHFDLSQRSK